MTGVPLPIPIAETARAGTSQFIVEFQGQESQPVVWSVYFEQLKGNEESKVEFIDLTNKK